MTSTEQMQAELDALLERKTALDNFSPLASRIDQVKRHEREAVALRDDMTAFLQRWGNEARRGGDSHGV